MVASRCVLCVLSALSLCSKRKQCLGSCLPLLACPCFTAPLACPAHTMPPPVWGGWRGGREVGRKGGLGVGRKGGLEEEKRRVGGRAVREPCGLQSQRLPARERERERETGVRGEEGGLIESSLDKGSGELTALDAQLFRNAHAREEVLVVVVGRALRAAGSLSTCALHARAQESASHARARESKLEQESTRARESKLEQS